MEVEFDRFLKKIMEPTQPTGRQINYALKSREDISHTISFDTIEGREPFQIELNLFQLPDVWGKDAFRFIARTRNARHPYDRDGNFNYFGDEIMNPALKPALNIFSKYANTFSRTNFERLRLEGAVMRTGEKQNILPSVARNSDGMEINITFNDDGPDGTPRRKKATRDQLQAFFEGMVADLKETQPFFRYSIKKHADLQPPLKPTAEQKLLFESSINEAWLNAMANRPKSVVLRNGTGFDFKDPQ